MVVVISSQPPFEPFAGTFRAEVKRLGGEFEALGISFEITGPWPPFHFADMDDNDSTGSVPVHG